MLCLWTMNVLLIDPDAESFWNWRNSKQDLKKNQIMTGCVIHTVAMHSTTHDRHGTKQSLTTGW